jgi:hypothetical protein
MLSSLASRCVPRRQTMSLVEMKTCGANLATNVAVEVPAASFQLALCLEFFDRERVAAVVAL